MKKAVFLFDIDKTCYNGFSQGDLMKSEVAAGLYSKKEVDGVIADIRKRYLEKETYEELAEQYLRDMAALLAGKKRADMYEHAKEFFTKNIGKLSDFLPDIRKEYADSHDFYFLSSGLDYSVQAMAELFDMTGYAATTPKMVNGVYQNELAVDISRASDKAREAARIMKGYGIEGSIAFGDSIADAGMMEHTKYGVCVHPSKELENMALQKGWAVVKKRNAVFAKVKELLG